MHRCRLELHIGLWTVVNAVSLEVMFRAGLVHQLRDVLELFDFLTNAIVGKSWSIASLMVRKTVCALLRPRRAIFARFGCGTLLRYIQIAGRGRGNDSLPTCSLSLHTKTVSMLKQATRYALRLPFATASRSKLRTSIIVEFGGPSHKRHLRIIRRS